MYHKCLNSTPRFLLYNFQCHKLPSPPFASNLVSFFLPTRILSVQAHISRKFFSLGISSIESFSVKDCNETNIFRVNKQFIRYSKAKRRPDTTVTELPTRFNMEWPKITLFGDSITRRSMDPDNGCWGSFIAHKVGDYFNVDVRGFEGYNSRWGLQLMPQLFPKSYLDKVEIFIPFFGHNDPWKDPFPAHVPVDEFEANMRNIIKYLCENGLEKRKIILITPTWYHSESFKVFLKELNFPPLEKSLDSAMAYSEAILRIAKDLDITALDFFQISLKQDPIKDMFCDGIHYSREGARLLFNNLMPLIEQKLEGSFKKPLADLWHVTPLEERPDVKPLLLQYREAIKKS